MKYAFVLAAAAALMATPALAGGRGGALVGGVVAPVTTSISGVKVNALNNVSVPVLSGNNIANGVNIASGNKTNVKAILSKNGVLGGLIGGLGHGCGCN